MFILQYLLLGSIAGVTAGLLGVGGGLIVVPALVMFFRLQGIPDDILMHLALGTSLSTIVVTSISSALSHHKYKAVDWLAFKAMLPGIVGGAFFGILIADHMSTVALRLMFGAFEVGIALNLIFGGRPSSRYSNPSHKTLMVFGVGIGAISVVLGVGGGAITVPLLLFFGMPLSTAIGTASACGLPIALLGAVGYVILGWKSVTIPYSVGFVYLPALLGIISASAMCAPLGAKFAHSLPVNILKKMFAGLLLFLGIKMLLF